MSFSPRDMRRNIVRNRRNSRTVATKRHLQESDSIFEPTLVQKSSLLQRVGQAFKVLRGITDEDIPLTDPPPVSGVTGEVSKQGSPLIGQSRFNLDILERAKIAAYKDYDSMALELPELGRTFDIVAENATSNDRGDPTFEIIYKPGVGDDVKILHQDTVERLRLQEMPRPVCWSSKKYGDLYGELVVGNGLIVDILPRSVFTMFRSHDPHGRLEGFFQKVGPAGVITFAPGQIVHLRAHHEWGARYGSSMARAGRFIYRKFAMMDDAMVANRLTRAVQRYLYLIDVAGMAHEDALEFLNEIEFENAREPLLDENGRLDLRAKVMADQENIYLGVRTSGVGGVQVLEGSKTLAEVGDVMFLWRRMLTMMPVPPAFMGVEKDVNSKSTLHHQTIQFAKYIRSTQQDELAPFFSKILRRQSALQGQILEPDAFTIRFGSSSILDEEILASIRRIQAETAKWMQLELGYPSDFIVDNVFQFPTAIAEDVKGRIEVVEPPTKVDPFPKGDDERERLGGEMRNLLQMRTDFRFVMDAVKLLVEDRKPKPVYDDNE